MKKTITLFALCCILLSGQAFAQLNFIPKTNTRADQSILALNSITGNSGTRHSPVFSAGKPLFFIGPNANDKSFGKGSIVIDAGIAFAIYKTKIHQEIGASSSVTFKHDTTDAAGGALYTVRGEYGVTDWLGVGARFGFTSFIDSKDSVTNATPKTTGLDMGVCANLHFIKTRRFEMPLCISFGYGGIKILSNDKLDTRAKGKGTGFGMALMPRIYFGDHFGMNFLLGFMSYNFGNIKYSDKDDSNLNKTWDSKVTLKASGATIGIGLQYKL